MTEFKDLNRKPRFTVVFFVFLQKQSNFPHNIYIGINKNEHFFKMQKFSHNIGKLNIRRI